MKNPIPAPIASFKSFGIALIMSFLSPVKLTIKNKTPETSTAASASCQEKSRPKTMVYVKNALIPIPDANAIGTFPKNPIKIVAKPAASAVATNTPG